MNDFLPSFYSFFRATRRDTEKHYLYDLRAGGWKNARLRELLEEILPQKSDIQDFRIEHNLPGRGRKTLLLNARRLVSSPGQPPLILLAMEEVTREATPPP